MRILLVAPGATWSTYDCWMGYLSAMNNHADIEVIPYKLHDRLQYHTLTLNWFHKKHKTGLNGKHLSPIISQFATEGVLVEALANEVDWVFFVSAMSFHPDILILLRRAGIKVAVYYTECPYDDEPQKTRAPFANVNFVNDKASLPTYQEMSDQVYYLPHSYRPEIHYPDKPEKDKQTDVVFVGTGFEERVKWLEAIDWTGIDFKLLGYWDHIKKKSPLYKHIENRCVDNDETVDWYRSSKIVLNLHRTTKGCMTEPIDGHIGAKEAYSLNPRTYEIAACEAVQVMDTARPELKEYTECIPCYETPAEMEQGIRFLLSEDDGREALAKTAHDLFEGCTFENKLEQIVLPALKEVE